MPSSCTARSQAPPMPWCTSLPWRVGPAGPSHSRTVTISPRACRASPTCAARALLSRLKSMLPLDARTVAGGTMEDAIGDAEVYNDDVIRPLNNPIAASGGTAILYGNLAPDGCVIKPPAADPRLLQHTGPALVFDC